MVRRFLVGVALGGALLAASFGTTAAAVPVRVTPTQCIFELHHMQHGGGQVFDAADAAYATGTPQAVSFYQANYNGWVVACHIQGQWESSLHRFRSAAEASYIDAITP